MELAKSNKGKNHEFSKIFSDLAITEKKHWDFWKKYSAMKEPRTSKWGARLIVLISLLFGTTFAIKFLEKHEAGSIKRYKAVAHLIPKEDSAFFANMIVEEEKHEHDFRNDIQSSYIKYISFVILGLADAIVENLRHTRWFSRNIRFDEIHGIRGNHRGGSCFDCNGVSRIRSGKTGL